MITKETVRRPMRPGLYSVLGMVFMLLLELAQTASALSATGGNTTTNIGIYRIHTFTNSATASNLVVTGNGYVDVLIVAGGGGGGTSLAGGGGAGGVIYTNSYFLTPGTNAVVVGVGGGSPGSKGANGSNSSFGALIAYGGGGGGAWGNGAGLSGGSGGGGAQGAAGGSCTNTQGNLGGTSVGNASGGGGGAGSAGSNGTSSVAGTGGAGTNVSISGSNVWYAGGGGGGGGNGTWPTNGAGGLGGGGSGSMTGVGTNGVAGTGGGGGGGAYINGVGGYAGGSGGSGIVIVRYVLTPTVDNAGGATNVTLNSAWLNGTLISTGNAPATVFVYWGTNDGGQTVSSWANTNLFAGYPVPGPLTTNLTGLSSNTTYFYSFYATNSFGTNWASPSSAFFLGQISLVATTPNAAELGPVPGAFTVSRPALATNGNLTVNYTLSGTATNGVDYMALSGVVTIPVGQTNATITVLPNWTRYDTASQTVQAALAPGPYIIGPQSNDVVTIADAVAPRVWSGTGNWNVASNWTGGIAPVSGDAVVITNGTVMLSNAPPQLAYFMITNASLVFTNYAPNTTNSLQATTVLIRNGATITHSPNTATSTNGAGQWVPDGRVFVACTNLIVDVGGKIDAMGKGYAGGGNHTNGCGPGRGLFYAAGQGASAGGYGGQGGLWQSSVGVVSATYGSAATPVDPGSGGGGDTGFSGGAGGGAIWLAVAANATVNGQILADGAAGGNGSGSGSGGGVYLNAQTLQGTGSITAKGADGGASYGGGGGGGRISVCAGDASGWAGRIDVGLGSTSAGGTPTLAQLGTVCATGTSLLRESFTNQQWRLYGVTAWAPSQLTVSNAYLSFEDAAFNLTVGSNVTIAGGSYLGLGAGLLTNAASLSVTGNLSVLGSSTLSLGTTNMPPAATLSVGGDMTLSNNASLYVYAGPTNGTTYYGALVAVTGNVMIASNSWIYPCSQSTNGGSPTFRMRDLTILTNAGFNANARGYGGGTTNGYGPGKGRSSGASTMSSGGSYGGLGGTGYWNGVQGLPTTNYGSMNAPSDPGSGGAWYNTGVGCPGGGLVRIEAQGDVTLNGKITAVGGASVNGEYRSSGSGGGIYITCRILKGAQGMLAATGGVTGITSTTILPGAGGGGRIAVWSAFTQAATGTWTITASGGSAPTNICAGLPGTVVFGRLASAPMITNNAATALTYTTATLSGTLISTGTAPTYVWVYWGPSDGATNRGQWANTNAFAGVQTVEGTNLTLNVVGLNPGATYYYRFCATNSLGETWASPTQPFTTVASVPVISNATSGATAITLTSAVLNGFLVSTGTAPASIKVFWGPTDGGTNGAWANTNSFAGYQGAGAWSTNVTLPASNAYYYYTFYATNSGGEAWASPSVPFVAAGVTLTATDPSAIENGANNTGTFTVQRPLAVTNLPLTVNYTFSGTASNGVDYVLLPGSVVIPAGATSNNVTITPIMDGVLDIPDKQVTLTLAPGAYAIGMPSNGTVTIQDVAPSATNTWTGTGTWTNTANWSDGIPPLPGQTVMIQGTTTLATASAALGPVIIPTNSTLIFSGTNAILIATDLTISGMVTHVANSAITTNQFGQWVVDARVCITCTNLTVATGGKIDVVGKGFAGGGNHTNGCGPGQGLFFNAGQGAGGGGYGGRGGLWLSSLGAQSSVYGSTALPADPGSGGGGDTGYSGGSGGGAIWLTVGGNVTVLGASTLSIGATNALTNLVSFSVTGGLSVLGTSTVFVGTSANTPQATALTVGGDMTLSNSASLYVYAGPTNTINTNTFGALVSVGGSLLLASNSWVYPYSQWANGGAPMFQMQDLTILTNAGFNANGSGFPGWHGSSAYPGGSYGGLGGLGFWTVYSGGAAPTNGSIQMPTAPGSGAGGFDGLGGNGGGVVRIDAGRRVTINGTITANGTGFPTAFAAGGSGGSIYLRCITLAGDTAVLSANGSPCGLRTPPPYYIGGGGGGGRIAIWRARGPDSTNGWSITVTGGAGTTNYSLTAATDGTIYWGSVSPGGTVFKFR